MRLVVVLLAFYAFCGVNADGVRAPASTVTCTGSGDPHYVTFDKVRHSLQMSGVFTIAHNDYFTVQAQMMSCHEADSFRTNVVKCIRSVSVTYNLQALDPLSKKYAQWAELTNIGEIYDDNNVNVVTIKWGGWYIFNASARVQNQNTRAWDDVITETNFDESTRKRTPWASFTRTTLGYFNFSSQWFKDNIANGGNPFVPGMVFARKSGNSLMLTLNPEYISTMIKLWYGGKLPMMMTDEEFSHMYEMPSVTIGYQSFSVVMPEVKSMLFTNGLCGCYDKNGTSEFMGAHEYCNLARNYIRGTRPGVEYGGTPLYQWGPLWFVNATKTDFNGTPDLHSRLKMLKEKQRTAKNGHLYHTRNLINEPAIQGEWENEQVHNSRKLHAARHDAATTPVDDGTQLIVPTEAQIAQFENINIQALPNIEQLTTDCMNLATDAAAGDRIFHEHITKACLVDRALVPDRPDLAATNGEVVVSALQTQAYMRSTYLGLNSEGEPDITNSHVQGMIAGVGGFVVAAAVLAALFVYRRKVAKTAARYAAAAQTPAAAEETGAAAPSASASAADEQPRTAAEESI